MTVGLSFQPLHGFRSVKDKPECVGELAAIRLAGRLVPKAPMILQLSRRWLVSLEALTQLLFRRRRDTPPYRDICDVGRAPCPAYAEETMRMPQGAEDLAARDILSGPHNLKQRRRICYGGMRTCRPT